MKNNDNEEIYTIGEEIITKEDFIAQLNAMLETGAWFYDAVKKGELQMAEKLYFSVQQFIKNFVKELQGLSWKALGLTRQVDQEETPFDELVKIKDLMVKFGKWYEKNPLEEFRFLTNERHLFGLFEPPVLREIDQNKIIENILNKIPKLRKKN